MQLGSVAHRATQSGKVAGTILSEQYLCVFFNFSGAFVKRKQRLCVTPCVCFCSYTRILEVLVSLLPAGGLLWHPALLNASCFRFAHEHALTVS